MKKKSILIITIAIVVVLAGAILAYILLQKEDLNTSGNLQKDNFTLTYEYKGNNNWEYTVTGTLPTPCYKVVTDAVVMESYPEQVVVTVKADEDSQAEICTTVIKDYSYTGTFNASKQARINLNIE